MTTNGRTRKQTWTAALAVIVEEAGGRFTDLSGKPVSLAIEDVLASNGRLHAPLLEALAQ